MGAKKGKKTASAKEKGPKAKAKAAAAASVIDPKSPIKMPKLEKQPPFIMNDCKIYTSDLQKCWRVMPAPDKPDNDLR